MFLLGFTGCIYNYIYLYSLCTGANCCCMLASSPVKQVISRNVTSPFLGMSAPSGSSTEGTGNRSISDAAMANTGTLPISDSPFSVDISTPPGSDKSRSLRERRHLPPLSNAVVPSHVGFNHRGYVPQAAREGGPPTGQLNQMNVDNTYHHNVHVDNPQVNFVEPSFP